jgi:F-type H+-transporting ATPase subunit b
MAVKKISWAGLMALLLLSCGAWALSQEPGGTSPEMPAPQSQPQSQSSSDSAHRHNGPGQRLVHESREAAGEEKDETEEFKKSSSVQAIARVTGLNLQQAYWLSVVLNFVVIAVVIVWAARKYLPAIFVARTAAIQKAMQEAQKASEEARRKLSEIESRLAKLDAEIDAMREHAAKEEAGEAERIQAAAKEEAHKIFSGAEREIAAAAKAARRELAAHAAELAVGLAQKQIRVDAPTDQALVRGFAGQLGSASDGPGKSGKDNN